MHLYLHVPFCARRCSYCDFAIAVRRDVPSRRFADRLLAEWRQWRDRWAWDGPRRLTTVYFGGGTPSRLAPAAVADILAALTGDAPLLPGAEVTLEANPEDVTPAAAEDWRRAGVTRVSLGAQSFDPAVLDWMHRTHAAPQTGAAVAALRAAGIGQVSLDLIFALPRELGREWRRELDQALALEPDHLSLYGLTVEPQTPLGRWVARGAAQPPMESSWAAEFLEADARLAAAGFRHYEVSNYARPGCEAVHNAAYWRRAPFLGLGPSAHSAAGARRWWNLRQWAAWDRALERGERAVEGEESLDEAAVRLEQLYLGLRTDRGIPASDLPGELADRWVTAGWACRRGERLVLTAEGWLRLDALVVTAGEGGGTGRPVPATPVSSTPRP